MPDHIRYPKIHFLQGGIRGRGLEAVRLVWLTRRKGAEGFCQSPHSEEKSRIRVRILRAQARGRTAVAETARRRRGALQEGETRNAEREPGDCAQADEACRSPIPQRSGLIWVQNPSSYVAMSRKVPPQAVTSRRRGGNRGVRHLVTNFSDQGAGERPRRMRTARRNPLNDWAARVDADAA